MQKMYLALNVSSVTVFYSHFSLAVLCLCVFVVMEQHGWVGFHQDKHAGQCPSQEADRLLFWMCSVPRGAADTMSSRRGMVGRDQPSSFWLCQHGYFRYTGILRWDRLHCSTFPRARKQLGVFSLAEHRDSVGSSVASPASPSPGVEGPWCRDPAPGGGTREQLPWTLLSLWLVASALRPLSVRAHNAHLLCHVLAGTGDARTAILEMLGALTKRIECESILLFNLPQEPSNLVNKSSATCFQRKDVK